MKVSGLKNCKELGKSSCLNESLVMMVVVISWDGESQTYSIQRVSVYWYIRNKTKMANSNFCLAVVAVRKWSLKKNARLPHVNQNRYIHECLEYNYSYMHIKHIHLHTHDDSCKYTNTTHALRAELLIIHCYKSQWWVQQAFWRGMFETCMRLPNKISRKKQQQRI